ncbi:YuiB family protein [Thermoactinomyces sp. DSM 45892]|uniref:YuiB family protein n=1 Tax=Thermoactinomyces sp. DSM 45892 TaxID=1882753 RepID=UPI000894EDD9|nr:YuiB family protein [Thermoactinomyces sp. DSM 45892]SDZ35154.1 Putative membrane protein [Thermoactinomyces sp. DSM 45892]
MNYADLPLSVPQLAVSIILLLVFFFGIGFILNMILKTTWLPIIVYVGFVAYIALQMKQIHVVDVSWLLAGLVGAVASGWTIQTLRVKGYKMF